MSGSARIPITNIHTGSDYTGVIRIGPARQAMNLILDTGSSAMAIDAAKYTPDFAHDRSTNLAQASGYQDDNSWTGAVIKTQVAFGEGDSEIVLKDAEVAVAYQNGGSMFQLADGILGLAYATLDAGYLMPADSWATKYSAAQVRGGTKQRLQPCLSQFQKLSFLTRRSFTHVGSGGADDLLNKGWLIVGGGEECTDLYSGAFQTAKILSDTWYCTNLKEIRVGASSPIAVAAQGPQGMPSNSIVDSGTNSLALGPDILDALLAKFTAPQQMLLKKAMSNILVSVDDLELASWPTITFVLESDDGDISLEVPPDNYWQVNTQSVGKAMIAITSAQPGWTILGLPLMNGYFTIFDGAADEGRGVVKFAKRKA